MKCGDRYKKVAQAASGSGRPRGGGLVSLTLLASGGEIIAGKTLEPPEPKNPKAALKRSLPIEVRSRHELFKPSGWRRGSVGHQKFLLHFRRPN